MEYAQSVLESDNYSYKEREWRAPSVKEDEEILFDEPGRVLRGGGISHTDVCCRSHYFRVTLPKYGFYTLRVKHGGGEESWKLDYDKRVVEALAMMDSDHRFRLLWAIMEAHQSSEREGYRKAEVKWKGAASEGRIKTRKLRNSDFRKVWIEEREQVHH